MHEQGDVLLGLGSIRKGASAQFQSAVADGNQIGVTETEEDPDPVAGFGVFNLNLHEGIVALLVGQKRSNPR
jgi:hypothetical protein